MNFGFYYRPAVNRILFHYVPSTGQEVCCYDTIVSESRIASYIGIAKGEIPARHYFGTWRSFPDTCDWSWQETRPLGFTSRNYGVDVFEGAYPYAGTRVTPSWGGSMFEALMPPLFVPEDRWAPGSWRANHPLTASAQIHHGLVQAGVRLLGLLARQRPRGRLRRLRGRRDRHGPQRLPVERGRHPGRLRLLRLPRPRAQARAAAVGVHERRRHPARRLPRAPVGAPAGAREPAAARGRLRRLRPVGLPRQRQRRHRRGVATSTCRSTRG